ncbi:MAG: alpha/beta fold hydrolase [Rhodoferax sp.]|jgi:pimeloyl-ACP methyl ester carboxylesterase|uniref:alpha/beta hydrolase n=1 Tax=Rhodoferax sp. TaxID=50421 RepID=UPI001B5EC703|nr:alpha/beta hydrolase [Rhodoferax sp.]MBP9148591.1 alpha/beta fold hydrolase [Rhodoferax sp.]MBP9735947.1 alpha/beta fold hydrolase [Rhodoferax sp.]
MSLPLPLVFSHANSFGAGTYGLLFKDLRQRGMQVAAIDQFGHDPRYPVTSNWPHLVQQLQDFAQAEVNRVGAPVFLVGHSLGGYLSLMTAACAPHLARGVLLLDAPVVGGWRAKALGVAKRTQLVSSVSPGAVSRKRRTQWADTDAALAHFAAKRSFARWDPQVLADYIRHGTHDVVIDGQSRRVLRFTREVETAIYNTLPHNLEAMLKKNPLQCPVAYIGGLRSAEMKQVGMALTQRVTKGRIMLIDGSHLFPMELPSVAAAAIEAALLNLAAQSSAG